MKIDLSGPVTSQLLAERSTKQVTQGSPDISQRATEDRTTLSADSTSVNSLASQVLRSPEIRQEKVDAFRQAVASGQYQVDSTKIASAILSGKGI